MERDGQPEQFSKNLHALFRYMKRNQWQESDTQTITPTQWTILRSIRYQGSHSVGQLADGLGVRPSTMSQMLDRMELAGLIYREPSKEDARTRLVRLTEQGFDMLRKLKSARAEVLAGPLEQLEPAEREMLLKLLGKVVQYTEMQE